ncbi:MAG: hypothetical protein ABFS46_09200, partial [Myxococcota bacterium]
MRETREVACPRAAGPRRTLALLLAILAAMAAAAAAQPEDPPDVPSGAASLRGRVVHEERPDRAAGIEVLLYALSPGAAPGLRRATSDAEGRFVFEGISDDPETAYLVGARYADIPFPGERVKFEAGKSVAEVEIPIAELTDDPARVRTLRVTARADRVGNQLVVHETVALHNEGLRAYFVDTEARTAGRAAFETRLPGHADGFAMPLGIVPDGVGWEEGRVSFYGPLYPGPQELAYSYVLPIEESRADLGRGFGRRVEALDWLIPTPGVEVTRTDLEGGETTRVETRSYLRYTMTPVPAGHTVDLVVDAPGVRVGAGELTLEEMRIFLELDDAALLVREEYRLRVDADTAAVGAPEAPLLRIPLPEQSYNLRFHPDLGLQPAPESGIDVLGPVPPGESVLELVYRLPRTGGPLTLERSASLRVPLLSFYVADTGLAAESDRLHGRRPVRTPDRIYMHLEAFEVEAEEVVSLRLAPLPPRAGLSRGLTWAVVGVVALGAVAFLSAPLRGRADEAGEPARASAARR